MQVERFKALEERFTVLSKQFGECWDEKERRAIVRKAREVVAEASSLVRASQAELDARVAEIYAGQIGKRGRTR